MFSKKGIKLKFHFKIGLIFEGQISFVGHPVLPSLTRLSANSIGLNNLTFSAIIEEIHVKIDCR